jgi:CHAT domain-containing protein
MPPVGTHLLFRGAGPSQCFSDRPATLLALALILSCILACRRQDPQTFFNHAKQTYRGGDFPAAEQEAKKGYDQFHSLNSEWAWRFVILRADALHAEGKDEQALDVLAVEPNPPSTGELAIKRLRVKSVANSAIGRTEAAESDLKDAEGMCAASNITACTGVYSARGRIEMHASRFALAQQSFEHELSSARAGGDHYLEADSLLNLSWAADEQTHFDEALDLANAAREISIREHFADISQTALGNMGWAYYKLGDREKARQLFADAQEQAEKLKDISDEISWITDAGYSYMDDDDFQVAEKSFQQSLDLARKIGSRDDVINSLIALSFVSEQTNKLDDAKRYADEALRMAREDGNKRDETYPLLVQGRIAAQQHDPVAAQNALEEVIDSKDSPVFLKWEAQRSLARLYEDEHQNEGASREYREALTTFEAARSELQHENTRLPFLTNATRIYDDYIHFLVSRGKTDEALQVAEYSRARTLSEGLGFLKIGAQKKGTLKSAAFQPDPVNAPQIARRASGSIFFYWLGEKQSYLWLLTTQKTTLFTLPPASEIDAAVRRYRNTLQGSQDPLETSNSDGVALYHTLVEPAKALLPKKNARVFIIPDGSLNTLNFETLIVPDPAPHYWIEDVTLADASSLRLLAASRPAAAHVHPLLIMGDAVSPNADYPELQKASVEMESIGSHFAPVQRKIFTREQATPAAYLSSKPEQFSYIHFVAHGTASRTNPLDSAIVLSRTTQEDDSFKLYARDIIHHKLQANLVTISTCYGAGFQAYSGEGLVGLSWAFLRAGAHNVIGALWEVSDVSTPQLMDKLYGNLKNGQKPDSALRAAKLSLLHFNTPFRKPFYWAPFQLYTGS